MSTMPEEPPRACTNCGQPSGQDTLCSFCTNAYVSGRRSMLSEVVEAAHAYQGDNDVLVSFAEWIQCPEIIQVDKEDGAS